MVNNYWSKIIQYLISIRMLNIYIKILKWITVKQELLILLRTNIKDNEVLIYNGWKIGGIKIGLFKILNIVISY